MTNYQQQAQLRESAEYAEAATAFADAHGVDVSIFAIKEVQKSVSDGRGNSTGNGNVKKADKTSIGEKVVEFIEGKLPEDDDGLTTSEWVQENFDALLSNVDESYTPTARP